MAKIELSKEWKIIRDGPLQKQLNRGILTGCLLGPDLKRFCLTFWYRIFLLCQQSNLHKTESAITLISQFISFFNKSDKNLL